ncbi:MAG: hypothetical protein RLZ04_1030, partial [Actinomycetota bacterium]
MKVAHAVRREHPTEVRPRGTPQGYRPESVHSTVVSQIPEPGVRVRGLRKGFGERPVLEPLDLDLEAGSIVSVIGPSGCGKTTLLRMLAGLESPDTGTVYLGGSTPDEARRAKKVAVVPQQPGLLPWRTVEANARLLLDVGRSASPSGSTSPAD